MHFKINLATQPYEDAREFFVRWTAIVAGLVVLACLLAFGAAYSFRHYRDDRANLERERNALKKLDEQQAQDLVILGSSSNRVVRDKSEFLNGLLKRKQISWTKVFINLESMMPPHIRVLSIAPGLDEDQVKLNITLGGDSRDRAAELVRRMEKSETFRHSLIVTEADSGNNAGNPGDSMRFQVSTEYVPEPVLPAVHEARNTGTPAQNGSGQ